MASSSYPGGAFKFDEWCDRAFPQWRFSLHSETVDAVKWMREAFEAGYISAVRHHDACKVHGFCGDCSCGGASWEQEDWAHVG